MMGLHFFSRASDGSIVIVSKHPLGCPTWHWSASIKRNAISSNRWRLAYRAEHRTHQWHDFYRLPFGWWLIVGQQDYHLEAAS